MYSEAMKLMLLGNKSTKKLISGGDRGMATEGVTDPRLKQEEGTLLYSEAMKLMLLGNKSTKKLIYKILYTVLQYL